MCILKPTITGLDRWREETRIQDIGGQLIKPMNSISLERFRFKRGIKIFTKDEDFLPLPEGEINKTLSH
jgi:hypothetical protein